MTDYRKKTYYLWEPLKIRF